jgi:hypothetical protein
MKRKKNNKVLHMILNGDSARWVSPIDKASKRMKDLKPAIEAGGCNIKGLPEWAITILAHNGYAVMQTHLGSETLVATTYVVWSEHGSDAAWRAAMAAHQEEMKPFLGKIAEASHIPEKPMAKRWIAVLLQHQERHDEIIPQIPRIASIINDLALCAIEYYGSMDASCQKSDSESDEEYRLMKILSFGEQIVAADYFGSDWENSGKYLVTCMNGVIRLLWPANRKPTIQHMMLAKEIVVTRGIYEGEEALEILFDDHSAAPFMLLMTESSVVGFFPGDPGDTPWMFAVWMWVDGGPRMVFSRMAHWRQGTKLPDLRPHEEVTQDG